MNRLIAFVVVTLWLCSCIVRSQQLIEVTADRIPLDQQTYDFSSASRCRILGQETVILQNDDHYILLLDGGFGTFRTELDGEAVSVTDLNSYTVAFDLSVDFSTSPGLEPLWQHKKLNDTPAKLSIVNHGGIWVSRDHNTIWTQGGHFYHGDRWANSSYFVPKEDIPQWRLWRMDLGQKDAGWQDVTEDVAGHSDAKRTFAGAAASIPNNDNKVWVGGLSDSTTSPTTPELMLTSTKQMLVFNESSNSIRKQEYYDPESTDGYWQGNLIHLPIGNGSGYLLSLMAVKRKADVSWPDYDGSSSNYENGTAVSLEYIPIYDIDRNIWFEQRTTSIGWDDEPESRTRFCAALFHDETENTFELWVHGGQKLTPQAEGVEEIYVLSMPSFIWTQVTTTLPQTNLIRSHTCHAVGGQLLIVGGYPTGVEVESNVTCDPEYIKVLNIGEEHSVWTGAYRRDSKYRTPSSVRDAIADKRVPDGGFAYEPLNTDFPSPRSRGPPVGAIVGGVIGGLALVVLIVLGIWFLRRRNNNPVQAGEPIQSPGHGQDIRLARLSEGS